MTDRFLASLTSGEAERTIESLRMGVPPKGFVRHFTVGRKKELVELRGTLSGSASGHGSGQLLRANYGGGKSHLLKVIREVALDSGYAVSFIEMDAFGGVRGNRMDQVYKAICRGVEVPGSDVVGLDSLFQAVAAANADIDRRSVPWSVRWAYSQWSSPKSWSQQYAVPFLMEGEYFTKNPRDHFYEQCWDALDGLNEVSKIAGLNGLVVLVDEFEDVVTNINRVDYQQVAIQNLLHFFGGKKFSGLAYFAVTPDFATKWWAYTTGSKSRLEKLEYFELSPPNKADVKRLARTIRAVHAIAYELEPDEILSDAALDREVEELLGISSQDRIRQTIEGIVRALDNAAE